MTGGGPVHANFEVRGKNEEAGKKDDRNKDSAVRVLVRGSLTDDGPRTGIS